MRLSNPGPTEYTERTADMSMALDSFKAATTARLTQREEQSSSWLFDYLRSLFSRDKAFSVDLKALKAAIRKGACTISEARTPTRPGGGA